MKNQRIFPGIILIGFGIFFFLQQANLPLFAEFMTWPTILMIVGIAFLCQGYGGKDYESILPGVILTGFGFHFHVVNRLSIWPNALGVFILIIALGFLLRYQKTRNGLFQGVLFLSLSGLLLFYNQVMSWFGLLEHNITAYSKFWPVALILVGIYLLFLKSKK
ncbi:LiaI-LiaF-like domain-containing protein [Niallia oryzisoli]|uniref:LiaI-LiaF-like domain-containing protein n=1 Tax=Niallia oryzisoli TaxID=1737571 RepID=UPI0037355328